MSDETNINQSAENINTAAIAGRDATVYAPSIHFHGTPDVPQNPQQPPPDIDQWVQTIRANNRNRIIVRYGQMRVLPMERSMELGNIYTNVNVLEKITTNQYLSMSEIQEKDLDTFRNGNVVDTNVLADKVVESKSKLMILGKPGAGKTIFLQHLMLKCIKGEMLPTHIPLFIELKDVEPDKVDLFNYIGEQLVEYGIEAPQVRPLLNSGRLLILLDGLDEVQGDKQISRKIEKFTDKYFNNRFVITCRIAAREYIFVRFTNVEIADFNDEQIAQFVHHWFAAKNDTSEAKNDADSSVLFNSHLSINHNLNQLARTPLLLTLLCWAFEQKGEFPPSRSQLYEEYLSVFLKEWDKSREVERNQTFSYKQKEDLLCEIAYFTFERNKYFFTPRELNECIKQYFDKTFDKSTSVSLNTQEVLKLIGLQHGLIVERAKGYYCFSHLTFHEYLTAKKIVEPGNEELLFSTIDCVTETRWREVFLSMVGILDNPDLLLQSMKQKIDGLLASDEKLQCFLVWVAEKSKSIEAACKPSAIRALYLSLSFSLDLNFSILKLSENLDRNFWRTIDRLGTLDAFLQGTIHRLQAVVIHFSGTFDRSLSPNLRSTLDLSLDFDLDLSRTLRQTLNLDLSRTLYLSLSLNLSLSRTLDFSLILSGTLDLDLSRTLSVTQGLTEEDELKRTLLLLKNQVPSPIEDNEACKQWWKENGANWIQKLREIMIKHRNIGHDWQFTDFQKELLKKYYNANPLLADCLNSGCRVSLKVRQQIEDTLLLPINSIPPTHLKTV